MSALDVTERAVSDSGVLVLVDLAHLPADLLRDLVQRDLVALINTPSEMVLAFNEDDAVVLIGSDDSEVAAPSVLDKHDALELLQ